MSVEVVGDHQQKAKDLAAIIRHCGGQLQIGEAVPESERDPRYDDAYGRLGEGLYVGFGRQAEATGQAHLADFAKRNVVLFGCYVMAKIMSYAPAAYLRYLEASPDNEAPSADKLATIMKSSRDVLKKFADTDRKTARERELNFGLLGYEPSMDPAFVIAADDGQEPTFKPEPRLWLATQTHIIKLRLAGLMPANQPGQRHCPAIGLVMDSLWDAGLDACANRPELYPAALANLERP